MNKLKSLFLLGMVALSSVALVSCEDGDGTTSGSQKPNIVLDNNGYIGSDANVSAGSALKFKVVATSNSDSKSKLVRLLVTRTQNNVSNVVKDTTLNTDNLANEVNATASNTAGEEKFKFEVTDKAGESNSVTITINTAPAFTETEGAFFNINGLEKGAYDLVTGQNISTTTASNKDSRDMQNTDVAGTTFTGSWTSNQQVASARTTFVKNPNAFDYNSATNTSAALAFSLSGTPLESISNPQVGDIYIAKLRGGNAYAAIKITKLEPTVGSGNNKGKLTFNYKK